MYIDDFVWLPDILEKLEVMYILYEVVVVKVFF